MATEPLAKRPAQSLATSLTGSNSALCSKFYPRSLRLPDFERKSSFCKRLCLLKYMVVGSWKLWRDLLIVEDLFYGSAVNFGGKNGGHKWGNLLVIFFGDEKTWQGFGL